MKIASITCSMSMILSTPACIIPTKNSFETLTGLKLDQTQNVMVTIALVSLVFHVAYRVENLGNFMQFVGSTVNTVLGFTIPVMLYTKVEKSPLKIALACLCAQ